MPVDARISEAYKGRIGSTKEQREIRERVNWLADQAHGEVLDLGCSQGMVAVLCARRGFKSLGIDADPNHVEFALAEKAKKPAAVADRLEFLNVDPTATGLADDSVDTVLCSFLLDELDDPDPVLAEMARVGRDDGVVAMTIRFGVPASGEGISSWLLRVLSPRLEVEYIDLADDHFRVLAKPGATAPEDQLRLREALGLEFEAEVERLSKDAETVRLRAREMSRELIRRDRELAKLRKAAAPHHLDVGSRPDRVRAALADSMTHVKGVARTPLALAVAIRNRSAKTAAKIKVGPLGGLDEGIGVARPVERNLVESDAGAELEVSVEIPEVTLPDGPIARPDLTAAVILDHFSAEAFRFEWNQFQIRADDWHEIFAREKPDILFVESTRRAGGGTWHDSMFGKGKERQVLLDLLEHCREHNIPTVFWNKEDPPSFSRFIELAGLFDHILTVDGECIPRYAEVLEREDVGLLPFGAQPRIHNPVSVPGGRVHDVAFAGTYFGIKYPERRKQMGILLNAARAFGLHIFSRRLRTAERSHDDWPPELESHVVGSLPYERVLAAYKAYKVFLNVNSVVDSPTMCARRVFELSACSTPVLSGRSRAMTHVFGSLVATASTQEEATAELALLLGDDELRDRRAHEAMREVFLKHTYGSRVDQVLEVAGLTSEYSTKPGRISLIASVDDQSELDHVLEQVARQTYELRQLVVVAPSPLDAGSIGESADRAGIGSEDLVVVIADGPQALGARLNIGLERADGDLIAILDPGCDYEPDYLTDLTFPFLYTEAAAVGKQAHYRVAGEGGREPVDGAEHDFVDRLAPGSLLTPAERLRKYRFDDSSPSPVEDLLDRYRDDGLQLYAADRFSFLTR